MSKIVEKWVAGFWSGKVIVVKWKFRETPKTFIMVVEDDPTYREAQTAVRWHSHFRKDDRDQQLFDTWEEALDRLHSIEGKDMRKWREKITQCQDRMCLLDTISDKMKEAGLT